MNTRSFIILLILIPLLLLGGAALYFLGPWGEEAVKQPEAGASKIEVLVSEPVISPILSFDGEKVWYMTREGRMFRIRISPPARGGDAEGVGDKDEYLLPEPVSNPVQIIWPATGNDFIVQFSPSPSLPLPTGEGARRAGEDYALYDAASKKFHSFPTQLQNPAFLTDPSKIIYDWTRADDQHELKAADKDGTNFYTIADLRRPDYEIVPSPTKEEVAIFGSDNLEPSYLILVNLGTGEFKDLDEKALYSGAKFSPDGSRLAVLKNDEPVVYDLIAPSPSLPLPTGEGGGEDYAWATDGQSLILGTKLGFFKYDLSSGQEAQLYKFKEGEEYEPTELILHPAKNLLFFVDRKTGYLYRLEY